MTQPQMHQPEREQLANSDPNPEHDIKDECLLPDETRLRKSVTYGAALLCVILSFGIIGNNSEEAEKTSEAVEEAYYSTPLTEVTREEYEAQQLNDRVKELEMRQKILFDILTKAAQ